jgi:hypothetical protein
MTWSEIDFHPDDKKLRQFAGLFFGFALLLACWQLQFEQRRPLATIVLSLGFLILAAGLARPAAVRWLYQGMMAASFPFGWLSSRLLLTIVYFGLFTPLACLFRLRGRDRLGLEIDRTAQTYWKTRPPLPPGSQYLRPF